MVLRAEVAFGPSTWPGSDPWGNDQVVTAAGVDDSDHLHSDEFVMTIDYPTDWYVRPPVNVRSQDMLDRAHCEETPQLTSFLSISLPAPKPLFAYVQRPHAI
jgi:hypothetical protein